MLKPIHIHAKAIILLASLFFVLFFTSGCDSSIGPIDNEVQERGAIVSSEEISSYTLDFMQLMLTLNEIVLPYDLLYNVDVYKIVYNTIDHDGNSVLASGALFIPRDANDLPLISVHHGTQTKKNNVASVDPVFSFDGIMAASLGYVACAPDYLGLGVSEMLHPYHIAKSSATAVIDFIRACKIYCVQNGITLNGQLFLAGYSEGGYVTLAAHKEIEQNYSNEFTITACAPMAGAYDLVNSAEYFVQQNNYGSPAFIAFLLLAYNETYDWNLLSYIFNSPFDQTVLLLFDGTKTTGQINQELPTTLNVLFSQTFIDNFLNGSDTQLISALEENTLLDWTPIAPIRLYHGNSDEFVPYENSTSALTQLSANGATNIELITIQGGTHYTSVIPSILDMIVWFQSFRNNADLEIAKYTAEYGHR